MANRLMTLQHGASNRSCLERQGILRPFAVPVLQRDVKDKDTALFANALEDHTFRFCSSAIVNLIEMLSLLDASYV